MTEYTNLIQFLQKSSVFVFSPLSDGFGLAVIEAMVTGLPVIVTENVGAKDIISDGKEGFIIPIRDVKSLKEKILYFYDNINEVKRMGKNARKCAEKQDWEQFNDKFYKILLDIQRGWYLILFT